MNDSLLAKPQARSRRFAIAVAAFAIANLAAWFAYHHFLGAGRQHLLRVDRYEPGEGAIVSARPTFEWQFNLDVAADNANPPATIQPVLAGKWQWRGQRNLVFQPDHDLPKATRYTITIPPERLRTPEGFSLPKAFVATFGTAPLRVVQVRQGGFEENRRYVLEIEFDDNVIPADLLSKLTLKNADGSKLGFTKHGEAVGKIVRVLTDSVTEIQKSPTNSTDITVRLEAGLAGVGGPLGLTDAFETKVTIGSTLSATEISANSDGRGKSQIYLRFNGPTELATLRSVLSVDPPVRFAVNQDYRGVRLEGDFQPGNRYAVKIAAPPKGADPQFYPRTDVMSVFIPDLAPFAWFQNETGYLGSQGNRTVLAHAVNLSELRVQVWRVYDGNLVEWRNSVGAYRWQNDPRAYAKPVASRIVQVKLVKNVVQDLHIAIDDLLPPDAPRDGVFRIGLSTETSAEDNDQWMRNVSNISATALVTLSDIALSAKREEKALTVWATSLSTAKPLDLVRVRVYSSKNQLLGEKLTNAEGLATVANLQPAEGETIAVILADRATTTVNTATTQASIEHTHPWDISHLSMAYRGLTWMDLRNTAWDLSDTDISGKPYRRTGQDAFIYTDRGAYRPGENVHLRAIVRRCDGGEQQTMPARWIIRRPDLREWKQVLTHVDGDGSASLDLALPDDLTTGRWTAELGLPGAPTAASTFGKASFLVEEFMPNRLKVGANIAGKEIDNSNSKRAKIDDATLRAVVQADYLFGRPGSGLQTTLTARLDPSTFAPADWAEWTFGDSGGLIDSASTKGAGAIETSKTSDVPGLLSRALNEAGYGEWPIHLQKLVPAPPSQVAASQQSDRFRGPWQLSVESSVQENGGRTVSAATAIQVDALPWYIGVHSATSNAAPGAPMSFEITLVDPSGKLAAKETALDIALLSESYNNSMTFRDGRYFYDSHRVLEPVANSKQQIKTAAGRSKIQITPPASGAYILRIADPQNGAITSLRFFASDGTPWQDNISREHPDHLEIVILPPRDQSQPTARPITKGAKSTLQFKPAQSARVLVRSPFAGQLLFTVETDHVLTTRVIEMPASTIEIPVEITNQLRPSAFVSASVIRAIDPNAKWRTHRAYGSARLSVDPGDRRLAIDIQTPAEVRPSSAMEFAVRVTDATGQPLANAPVTLAAVDEGILQLTSFRTPDPLGFFYAKRAAGVDSLDIFSQLMPEVAKPDKTSAIGGDGGSASSERYHSPVAARRVRSVALFVDLRTNEQGIAATNLSIPEFAGQLRFMAVAHSSDQFGSAQRPVFVRSPLLVQSSFPRFAAPGDKFNVPVTLFNNGKAPAEVTLTAQWLTTGAAAPLAFANSPDQRLVLAAVTIPAGKQHVQSLPCIAGSGVGVARIRLTATSGAESCTETTELPVRPPSPYITRGGFALVTPAHGEEILLKDEFLPGTEHATITLSPMPSLQLPQGLDYLERYPYGCAEQTISSSFPLIYLSEIGPRIAPGVFDKERVAEKVQYAVSRLLGMQTADGGLSMWPGNRESWPWASVYAAHFLTEARSAGHTVPQDFQKHLLAYLRDLINKSGDNADLLECQAYASYVLALNGKPDRAFMSRLAELTRPSAARSEDSALRAQARLYLSLAWLAAGRRDLASELFPASLPPLREKWQNGGNIGSPVRDRAMYVSALLTLDSENPAIPAAVQQLADAKWRTTQDVAFASMAIGKYLRQIQNQKPYENGEMTLDGTPLAAGPAALEWKSTVAAAATTAEHHLLAKITGPPEARGYLTYTRTGVPREIPANEDHGITIRRRYLNEQGKPIESNQVRTGDLILVELTIESSSPQQNLVVEDLLPAGLEIENPRLQTTTVLKSRRAGGPQPPGVYEELQQARLDVRDDRMIIFGHLPGNGQARHTYAARAVVPGVFALPPARVESMYDPATSSLWGPGGNFEVKPLETRTIADLPRGE